MVMLLLAFFCLLPLCALSQGNPCPPPPNSSVASRWCGNSLCFSGAFDQFGVLQRGPVRAAYYGATGVPPQPGVPIVVSLVGTLEDGATPYNKSFSTTSMADGTWKVSLAPKNKNKQTRTRSPQTRTLTPNPNQTGSFGPYAHGRRLYHHGVLLRWDVVGAPQPNLW